MLEPIKQLMNEGHLDGGHIEAEDNEIPDITLIQPPPVDELPEEMGGVMDNCEPCDCWSFYIVV